jgi:hypothetical protein
MLSYRSEATRYSQEQKRRSYLSYVKGLLDGIEFKQTAYALDRDSRKAALARFLKRASAGDPETIEEERRSAA